MAKVTHRLHRMFEMFGLLEDQGALLAERSLLQLELGIKTLNHVFDSGANLMNALVLGRMHGRHVAFNLLTTVEASWLINQLEG